VPGITDIVGLVCIVSVPILLVGLAGYAVYMDTKTLEFRIGRGAQAPHSRAGFEVVIDKARRQTPASSELDLKHGFEVEPITGVSPVAEKEADDHG